MPDPNEYAGATATTRLQYMAQALDEAAGDPLRAQAVARKAASELNALQRLMRDNPGAMLPPYARTGAQKIFRVPDVGSLGPGVTLPTEARWPQAGWVLAMYGTVFADTPDIDLFTLYAGIEVAVQYQGGDRNLVINGDSGDFAPYQSLFTVASPWFPLGLYVSGTDTTWQIQIRNAFPGAFEFNVFPKLLFAFVPDKRAPANP